MQKGLQNGDSLPDIRKNPNRFNEPRPSTSNPGVTGCITRNKSFVQSSTMPSNQFATEQLPSSYHDACNQMNWANAHRHARHRAPINFTILMNRLHVVTRRVARAIQSARLRVPFSASTLRVRIVLIIAVAIAVPLGTIGLAVSLNYRAELRREAERGVVAEASATAKLIDHHLTSLLATARATASLGQLRSYGDDARADQNQALREFATRLGSNTRLATFTLDGNRFATSNDTPSFNISAYQGFVTAVEGTQAWQVTRSLTTGRSGFYVMTPITASLSQPSQVIGVLGMGVELEDLDDIIDHPASKSPLNRVITFVIDDESNIVLDPGSVTSRPSWTSHSPKDWLRFPFGVIGNSGSVTFSLDGQAFIAGYSRIEQTRWAAVVAVPQTTIMAPANRSTLIAILTGTFGAVVATLIGAWRVARIVRPLARIAEASRAFGSGDATVDLPEVGEADQELQDLIDAFRRMRWEIDARTGERELAHARLGGALESLSAAMTEIEKSHQQVVQRERLHAIGQLASGISHDFNNSLSIIIGYCDTLITHFPSRTDDARLVTLLTRIRDAAHDGSILVSRLRDFSKGAASPRQLRPLDLNAIIDHSRALASVHIEELHARGTPVSLVASLRSVPLVLGDASELGSALMNLILNAFDAMPNGGTLTIETERQARFVRLTVRDTGTGMSDETRQRCFEPYFTTKGANGTGIGLAMVYGVVARHGGTISVSSEPDHGTQFEIHLLVSHDGDAEHVNPLELPLDPLLTVHERSA